MFKKYITMFRDDLRYAMQKRCGSDELNNFIMLIAFIYVITALITHKWGFVAAGFVFVVISYLRVFSTKLDKRRRENEFYLRYMGSLVDFVRYVKFVIKMKIRSMKDKEYAYFVCGTCHQVIRVPKGKNKVSIRCPKCNATFIKRT